MAVAAAVVAVQGAEEAKVRKSKFWSVPGLPQQPFPEPHGEYRAGGGGSEWGRNEEVSRTLRGCWGASTSCTFVGSVEETLTSRGERLDTTLPCGLLVH